MNAFIVCDELGYTKAKLASQRELCGNTIRILNGYIRYVRSQKQGYKEYGERAIKEEAAFYDTAPCSTAPLIYSKEKHDRKKSSRSCRWWERTDYR